MPQYPAETPTNRQVYALVIEMLAALERCNADKAAIREAVGE